jgi:hypothetical protein
MNLQAAWRTTAVSAAAVVFSFACGAAAQTAAPSTAPKAAGTVKSVSGGSLVVTNTAGQDYTVTLPATAKVLVVPPGSHDLKSATLGQAADIAVGDRAIVNGTDGDTGTTLTAQRVIVMKAGAIAQSHAAQEEAWTKGIGGIVKSVDSNTGTVVVSSGLKTVTVTTTPATIVRHYADGSIKFDDAVKSTISALHPGDQLRVRGQKSADGTSIAADEIVAGSFRNYSGVISAIDPATTTVTLKDLTTKKNVTVYVPADSDIRKLPPQVAAGMAARMHGGGAAGPGGRGAGISAANASAGGPPPAPGSARGAGTGSTAAGGTGAGSTVAGGIGAGSAPAGGSGAGRAGMDLSQMLSRLPTETLGDLKIGDAVMIVATASADGKQTSITLLSGVEAVLAAQPQGEAMTLSPWSVGSATPDGGQ